MSLIDRINNILIDKNIDYKNNRGSTINGIFIPNNICNNYDDVKKLLDAKIANDVEIIEKNIDIIEVMINAMPKSITPQKALIYIFKKAQTPIYNLFVRYYVAINNIQLLIFNRDNTINYETIENDEL